MSEAKEGAAGENTPAASRSKSASELLVGSDPERLPIQERRDEADLQRVIEEHALRKSVAKWSYRAVAVQIAVADVVFVVYAWAGREWDVPSEAIASWLGATVVQAIGVALVITRYLFPRRTAEI